MRVMLTGFWIYFGKLWKLTWECRRAQEKTQLLESMQIYNKLMRNIPIKISKVFTREPCLRKSADTITWMMHSEVGACQSTRAQGGPSKCAWKWALSEHQILLPDTHFYKKPVYMSPSLITLWTFQGLFAVSRNVKQEMIIVPHFWRLGEFQSC